MNRVTLQWKLFSPADWTARGAASSQAEAARWNELRTREATASVHKLNIAPGAGSLVGAYGELLAALNTAMLEIHRVIPVPEPGMAFGRALNGG